MDAKELTTAYNNLMRTNTTTVDRQSYEEDVELLYRHALGQELKQGYWIWNIEHTYCKCSECGIGMGHTEYDYCPNCGCRMESEGCV